MNMNNINTAQAIKDCMEYGGHVYLTTDWHMVKYDKETGLTYKRPDFYNILHEQNDLVTDKDVFIFLGDLMDSEITDTKYLDEICTHLAGKYKFLIRGNNDCFADETYLQYFDDVSYGIIVDNILLSHTSVDISKTRVVDWNIHGHIHRDGWNPIDIPYYHPCDRNINICEMDIVDFAEVIKNAHSLATNNCCYITGKTEKPGMSQFVQNMASAMIR